MPCFLHPQPVRSAFRVSTLPSRKSTAQGQGKVCRCWNGIGLDKQEKNEILVTSLPHNVSAGLKLVINNLLNNTECSSCCCCWLACYCLACNGHGPAKDVISFSLNNAAFDRPVLGASCKTRISKWLVCFEKLSFWRQPGRGLQSF